MKFGTFGIIEENLGYVLTSKVRPDGLPCHY